MPLACFYGLNFKRNRISDHFAVSAPPAKGRMQTRKRKKVQVSLVLKLVLPYY